MLPIIQCTEDEIFELFRTGRLHGLYQIPDTVYRKVPALNSSTLKEFAVSPANSRAPKQRTETPAMRFGSAAHCKILEYEKFKERYVESPQFNGPKNMLAVNGGCKEQWDEFKKQDFGDRVILDSWEAKQLDDMALVFHGNNQAHDIHHHSYRELSAFWRCQKTGTLCKVRFDMLSEKYGLADYKTTSIDFVDPVYEWSKQVEYRRYWLQASFYMKAVLEMPELETIPKVNHWIFQRTSGSYDVGISFMTDFERSMSIVNGLARAYQECSSTNSWPTKAIDPFEFKLPEYV